MAVVALAMKTDKTWTDGNGCIKKLLEHGAAIDAANKARITPLHEACKMASGSSFVVDLLPSYSANVNKMNTAGESCLFQFLNHPPNVNNHSLLIKLLHLTSPLTLYNHKGQLPSTLMLPCFMKQRDQLQNSFSSQGIFKTFAKESFMQHASTTTKRSGASCLKVYRTLYFTNGTI